MACCFCPNCGKIGLYTKNDMDHYECALCEKRWDKETGKALPTP